MATENDDGSKTVDVMLPMKVTPGTKLYFRVADAMATFDHDGIQGNIAWCLPGGPVQVQLTEGERTMSYSLSINDIAQLALRMYREEHPRKAAAEGQVTG